MYLAGSCIRFKAADKSLARSRLPKWVDALPDLPERARPLTVRTFLRRRISAPVDVVGILRQPFRRYLLDFQKLSLLPSVKCFSLWRFVKHEPVFTLAFNGPTAKDMRVTVH